MYCMLSHGSKMAVEAPTLIPHIPGKEGKNFLKTSPEEKKISPKVSKIISLYLSGFWSMRYVS